MPSEVDFELEVDAEEIEEDLVLVGAIVSFFEAGCECCSRDLELVEGRRIGKDGSKEI